MKILLFLLSLICVPHAICASLLNIKIKNLKNEKGEILYLLFSSENGFPDDANQSIRQGRIPVKNIQSRSIVIPDLENGKYAVSLFHDSNSNEKLDTNFLGIPKESFGFSQNPKVFFGPPSFGKSSFSLEGETTIDIKLINF